MTALLPKKYRAVEETKHLVTEEITKSILDHANTNRVCSFTLSDVIDVVLESPHVAIVDRNAPLPDNKEWHKVEREYEAFCAGQNSMVEDGWVKEINEYEV